MKDTTKEEIPAALIRLVPSSASRLLRSLLRPIHPRCWIISVFLGVVLLLVGLGVFNYTVDSKLFFLSQGTRTVIQQAAGKILNGEAVVLVPIDNIEQRYFQKCIVEQMVAPRKCIVMGSSRVQFVHSESLGLDTLSVFNHSIPASGIRDMVAVLGLYWRVHGRYPERVVIGIDPWMFEPYEAEFRWVNLSTDYKIAAQEIWPTRWFSAEGVQGRFLYARKAWRLVDWGYTLANLKAVFRGDSKDKLLFSVDPEKISEVPHHVIYPDGSREWSFPREPDGQVSSESARLLAVDHAATRQPDIRFRARRMGMLRDVILHLQAAGVKVQVLAAPLHPEYLRSLQGSTYGGSLQQLDAEIVSLCEESEVSLVGSFTRVEGLKSGDFFDFSHPAKWVYDQLWDSLTSSFSGEDREASPSQ